ncbi:SGNH/GDSL hydrolase family protein [Paenibacillus agaridevorans]|nr:GDSL-type esterase/lipase family protein [Paenibacillus agaridevorans]
MIKQQRAESFVFVGEEALKLRYKPLRQGVVVRSHVVKEITNDEHVIFKEHVDYVVDYERGVISRTSNSRIPDWSLHPMFGLKRFDHTLYADYSNQAYTVYAQYDYIADRYEREADPQIASSILPRTWSKLQAGAQVTYTVLGDSISTGGEASAEQWTYFNRLSRYLCEQYGPSAGSGITLLNKAIGGETSKGGLARIERDVIPTRPDLVTIGYGMNDQSISAAGQVSAVPLPQFVENMETMIKLLREQTSCDIILVTPCSPNPDWQRTSGRTVDYAAALCELGIRYNVGVADAYAVWEAELAAGKTPGSLLLNNINHPNDYGHELYLQAFLKLLHGK